MRSRRPHIPWVVIALSFLVLGQAAMPPTAAAQPPTGTTGNPVAESEKSVIQLVQQWRGYIDYGNGRSEQVESVSVCTGFFVTTTGHAVTAGHCVEPAMGRRDLIVTFLSGLVQDGTLTEDQALGLIPRAVTDWQVQGFQGGSDPKLTVYAVQPRTLEGAVLERSVVAQVLDVRGTDQGDVALLKIDANNTPALPVATVDPENNTPVTAIGFPAAVAEVVDSTMVRAEFKSGTVSSHQISPSGVPVTGVNADLSGGMSGGPTVDSLGNVLGVNSFKTQDDQNFNFITDTTDLHEWLQGKRLQLAAPRTPPVAPPPPPVPSSRIPTWVLIALGGTGLVLVVGGVLVARSRRRKEGPAVPVAAMQPEPAQQSAWPPPSGSDPWNPTTSGSWGGAAGRPAAQTGWAPTTPPFGEYTAARQCASCGTSLPTDSKFCANCGQPAT